MTKMHRRHFLAAVSAVPLLGVARAHAATPAVFAPDGIAINGYDPIGYFDAGAPLRGQAEFKLMWRGSYWHFASAAHRDRFEADPTAYAPAYGGYCAFAVSNGYTASTVPEAWTIHEGRLFLNYSLGVRRRWKRDIPGHVSRADMNWPGVLEG